MNFDYVRQDVLRRDPCIVQPVAVRLSDSPEPVGAAAVQGAAGSVAGGGGPAICPSSDLDETEDEAKRAEQLARPSGQKQPKGTLFG